MLTSKQAHGYALFSKQVGTGDQEDAAGETHFIYRHKKSKRWVITDHVKDTIRARGSLFPSGHPSGQRD